MTICAHGLVTPLPLPPAEKRHRSSGKKTMLVMRIPIKANGGCLATSELDIHKKLFGKLSFVRHGGTAVVFK